MFHLTNDQVSPPHLSLKVSTSYAVCIKKLSGIDSGIEVSHQESLQSYKETLPPQTYSQALLLTPTQPSAKQS